MGTRLLVASSMDAQLEIEADAKEVDLVSEGEERAGLMTHHTEGRQPGLESGSWLDVTLGNAAVREGPSE